MIVGSSALVVGQLERLLRPDGIEVRWHRQAAGLIREPMADAIVLDVAELLDGTAAIRRVTAARLIVIGGDEQIAGGCLAMGADVWVPRGTGWNLLAAQVRAILRADERDAGTAILEAGLLRIDVAGRRATLDGRELSLKPREFDLLKVLVENQGRVLSRDRILAGAWGTRFVGEPKTVDVHVAWIRPKLEGSGLRVTTLRGVGYRLDVLDETRPGARVGLTSEEVRIR